jgi:hypothetical protein
MTHAIRRSKIRSSFPPSLSLSLSLPRRAYAICPDEINFLYLLRRKQNAANWRDLSRSLDYPRLSFRSSLLLFPDSPRRRGDAEKVSLHPTRIRFPTICHSRRLTRKINFRPSPHDEPASEFNFTRHDTEGGRSAAAGTIRTSS